MKNKPLPEWEVFNLIWHQIGLTRLPISELLSNEYGPFYGKVFNKYKEYIGSFNELYIVLKQHEHLRESKLFDIIMDLT